MNEPEVDDVVLEGAMRKFRPLEELLAEDRELEVTEREPNRQERRAAARAKRRKGKGS